MKRNKKKYSEEQAQVFNYDIKFLAHWWFGKGTTLTSIFFRRIY